MENRIKIDDVWYVREDAIDDPMDHHLLCTDLFKLDAGCRKAGRPLRAAAHLQNWPDGQLRGPCCMLNGTEF